MLDCNWQIIYLIGFLLNQNPKRDIFCQKKD